MSHARIILDAETPKGVFRQLPAPSIEKPLKFGLVPEGKWFRCGTYIFRRVTVKDHQYPHETAEVMRTAPGRERIIGTIWTFDVNSWVYPVTWTKDQHRAFVPEAEDPKSVLRLAGNLGHAAKVLKEISFERVNDKTWQRLDTYDRDYGLLRVPVLTSIWWDPDAGEWCRKREQKFKHGYRQLGFDAHKTFNGLFPF